MKTSDNGVITKPIWALIHITRDVQRECQCTDLSNALWLEERVVNIPSGVRL